MPYVTTSDGTELYYTEQGDGQPIVLSHGWPLCSDAWQVELKVFADAGYRVIAHDRRGHGRSSKTYRGNDMETYAKDLAEVMRLHSEYVQAQMRTLAEQASEMGQIVSRAAMDAAKPKV